MEYHKDEVSGMLDGQGGMLWTSLNFELHAVDFSSLLSLSLPMKTIPGFHLVYL
jgi:hypothetical protein